MQSAVQESTLAVEMDLSELSVNTLRTLAMDAVQAANSGHPGMPMGAAAMAYVLWRRHMTLSPDQPRWANRDRFVLSAGHGSMLIYGLLHLAGFPLSLEDIKNFRQWGSQTPGHPEYGHTVGVETTTGPLGQGFANGVGMAIAEQFLSDYFNRPEFDIVDHHTYAIVSDGDLMEGISHEAASLAGHLGLGKLIYLYDDNKITIDGSTDISFTEDVQKRFESYGWQVLRVDEGDDVGAIDEAITLARRTDSLPTLVMVRTRIGYGSPNKENTSASHGAPLGEDEIRLTKEALHWPSTDPFHIPPEVLQHMREIAVEGSLAAAKWDTMFEAYRTAYPDLAMQFELWGKAELPEGVDDALPVYGAGTSIATRVASGKCINALAALMPNLIGGSADLAGSNNTSIVGAADFDIAVRGGRNINFGVREHGMASICNGMQLHGGIRPFCGTFLIFSDYMRPAIRLSALMKIPVIYVFTHDSIGLGEDGPTHQPVEQLMALRTIPNCTVIRPADGNETVEAWKVAMQSTSGPVILALSRQNLPVLDRTKYGSASGTSKGAYIVRGTTAVPDVILIATGSEVSLAIEAADALELDNIQARVVSMPSWELFEAQDKAYQDTVLSPEIEARVSIEAGVSFGWERFVGLRGVSIGLDRFGASAPAPTLFEKFGFTVERILRAVREVM